MTTAINSIQPAGPAAVDESRKANKANLDKAARQFEAVFVNMMLKEARKTSFGDGLFDGEGLKTFRDMQDMKVAEEMAKRGTLGIARALADFMERAQPLKDDAATAASTTGETTA